MKEAMDKYVKKNKYEQVMIEIEKLTSMYFQLEKDKNINCHLRQALWPQMSPSWQAQGQKHHFLETNNILIFCGMQT